MTRKADGSPFTTERRRAVATACTTPKTRADLGRIFGEEPGGLQSVLKALVAETVLEKTKVEHARGEGFLLRKEWRKPLAKAIAAAHPVGLLTPGLRVLLVSGGQPAAVGDAIRAAVAEPEVIWGARVDGPARFILAVRAGAAAEQADRIQAEITQAGAECLQVVVTGALDRPRLARYATTIAERSHIPALNAAG
jgi:hypothetical protein